MPQLNLTKLSGQELRQRLDSSRARGDATLAYEILREMSLRREAAGDRKKLAQRRAQPHLVSVDLGDPMDHGDEDDVPPMPHWQPPAEKALAMAAAAEAFDEPAYDEPAYESPPAPEPPAVSRHYDDEPPLTLERPEPARRRKAEPAPRRARQEAPPPREARPRRALPISAGFLLGGLAGLGLGWVVSGRVDPWGVMPARGPAVAEAPAKLDISVAAADTPPPAAVPLDVLPTDTVPPEALAPVAVAETPAAEAPVAELAPPPPPGPAEVVKVDTSAPPAATDACALKATSADRTICEDPALQKLQTRLQQAYAEALEAHEDRTTLRLRQLAWRDARNDIADPDRLARLYEQRIQKLQAATAAARTGQH